MSTMPDARGRFGDFGGRFVPETVMGALDELLAAWQTAWSDPAFHAAPGRCWRVTTWGGRPRSTARSGSRSTRTAPAST